VPPPSDRRDAAAAAAVGTTPVDMPGFDKCSSLHNIKPGNKKRYHPPSQESRIFII